MSIDKAREQYKEAILRMNVLLDYARALARQEQPSILAMRKLRGELADACKEVVSHLGPQEGGGGFYEELTLEYERLARGGEK